MGLMVQHGVQLFNRRAFDVDFVAVEPLGIFLQEHRGDAFLQDLVLSGEVHMIIRRHMVSVLSHLLAFCLLDYYITSLSM